MSKIYVLDASIIIKWFINEIHSEKSLKIRDTYVQELISIEIPDLLYYEVINGLKYSNLFTTEELIKINQSLIEYDFNSHHWNSEDGKIALRFAVSSETTIYDCIYLALAEKLNCTLITADQKFISRINNNNVSEKIIHVRNFSL